MYLIDEIISCGFRGMRFKHLELDVTYQSEVHIPKIRYISPDIEVDLNTRVLSKSTNHLIMFKPSVLNRLMEDMGWSIGIMDSNDRFFI